MDTNADTTCIGMNFVILSYTQRVAQVFAYDPSLPPTEVPIVSGATAYDCPITSVTYILVVNEALYYGTRLDHSLWNPNQVRSFGNPVWDNPFDPDKPLGIDLAEVFIPLQTNGTKLFFKTRAPTARELETCVHIDVTSKSPWEPQAVQLSQVQTASQSCDEYDPRSNESELSSIDPLMEPSNWRQVQQVQMYDARSQDVPVRATYQSSERHPRATPEQLSERFGISLQRARATLRATLQRGTRSAILPLSRRYRADRMYDAPVLKGKFSTDTAYFPCKSLRGNIASQIYFHKCGFYANYNIPKVDDDHVGPTLPRFISDYGVPGQLTMDGAQVQVGRKTTFMKTIRRANIDHHVSGPYKPAQNPAEGGIRELKRRFYRFVTKYNIPMRVWDFVLDYTVDIMNVTVNYSKYSDGRVPLEVITGITSDISEYMDFTIWGWVYFRTDGGLGVNEIGRWLGVSHRVGPLMTYWVLPRSGIPISSDTVQAITQAELLTDAVKEQQSRWADGTRRFFEAATIEVNWEGIDDFDPDLLFDLESEDEEFLRNFNMPIDVDGIAQDADNEGTEQADDLDAPNYVGMEVGLNRGNEDGLQRATVRRRVLDEDGVPSGVATRNPMTDTRRFEVEFANGEREIFNANTLAENILEQVDEFGHKQRLMEEIGGHRRLPDAIPKSEGFITTEQGIRRRRQTTRGWELYPIWKDGSSNFVSLKEMKESFPIETAEYAVQHGISDEPAFAWWVPHVLKKRDRFVNKVKSKYWERTHKYGIRIPKTIQEALAIDRINKNHLWEDSIKEEMKNNRVAFEEYDGDVTKLVGYKRITGHMVFDVKLGENFRRKARFVADGHLTSAPASMTYSTVVSRDSVRILLMIAALNGLDLQCADIQNAFLTAPNLEKCYMIAGPEFLDEEGKTFIVRRALYGLKSAALAFRSFLAQNIEDLGFFPSEADPDVWMRPAVKADGKTYYEYILCYVDDIMCISEKAMDTMQQLQKKFKFKKDLIEPPKNYLGARVRQRTIGGFTMWTISSFDYVVAAVKNVEEGIKDKKWQLPAKAPTPMASNYEPELDGTPELNQEDHTYYQELIGVLRWATELGRVDILFEVSLLSQYQACPREGHMNQVMRIFSYLKKKDKWSLYMDYRPWLVKSDQERSNVKDFKIIYRDAKEELPHQSRMPEPRGMSVETTAYVDASHAANKKTRRSHTGYLILVNSAPVLWYSKRQNTVEASTFGSEFIALKACVEAITHLRYKLRMFGIPIDGPTLVFCDNESVVKNSTLVESVLNKKHNSIAYHYVRWNVAAEVVEMSWIASGNNLVDPFTKRLAVEQRDYLFGEWTY